MRCPTLVWRAFVRGGPTRAYLGGRCPTWRVARSRPTVEPVQRRLAEDLPGTQRLLDPVLVGVAREPEGRCERAEHEAVVVRLGRRAGPAPSDPAEIVATLLGGRCVGRKG